MDLLASTGSLVSTGSFSFLLDLLVSYWIFSIGSFHFLLDLLVSYWIFSFLTGSFSFLPDLLVSYWAFSTGSLVSTGSFSFLLDLFYWIFSYWIFSKFLRSRNWITKVLGLGNFVILCIQCICVFCCLFWMILSYLPNPSAWAGYNTRSFFKRSLTVLDDIIQSLKSCCHKKMSCPSKNNFSISVWLPGILIMYLFVPFLCFHNYSYEDSFKVTHLFNFYFHIFVFTYFIIYFDLYAIIFWHWYIY